MRQYDYHNKIHIDEDLHISETTKLCVGFIDWRVKSKGWKSLLHEMPQCYDVGCDLNDIQHWGGALIGI